MYWFVCASWCSRALRMAFAFMLFNSNVAVGAVGHDLVCALRVAVNNRCRCTQYTNFFKTLAVRLFLWAIATSLFVNRFVRAFAFVADCWRFASTRAVAAGTDRVFRVVMATRSTYRGLRQFTPAAGLKGGKIGLTLTSDSPKVTFEKWCARNFSLHWVGPKSVQYVVPVYY